MDTIRWRGKIDLLNEPITVVGKYRKKRIRRVPVKKAKSFRALVRDTEEELWDDGIEVKTKRWPGGAKLTFYRNGRQTLVLTFIKYHRELWEKRRQEKEQARMVQKNLHLIPPQEAPQTAAAKLIESMGGVRVSDGEGMMRKQAAAFLKKKHQEPDPRVPVAQARVFGFSRVLYRLQGRLVSVEKYGYAVTGPALVVEDEGFDEAAFTAERKEAQRYNELLLAKLTVAYGLTRQELDGAARGNKSCIAFAAEYLRAKEILEKNGEG
ncbi:MAG: hypothetical protein Q4G07_03185 [Oscillospiraceae bacterium]|nr:hypothetical protein [Oscillospiraceae bacterium]